MELPHDGNGDVDWNTLGNMLTAHILGEVIHAKFVDWKYGRVSRRYGVDTSWQFAYEKDDIMVLKKTHTDSPLLTFMGRGVIDLPMKEVTVFFEDICNREQWDQNLMDIKVLRKISNTDFIAYMHHRARKCVIRVERDFLYYERACHIDDKFVMTTVSVDLPEYPPIPGLMRAQLLPGSGWVLEPYDGSSLSTLVSYVVHADLKALPPIIVNQAQRRQMLAIRYIRDILTPPSLTPSPPHKHRKKKRKKTVQDSTESLQQGMGESDSIWVGPSENGTHNRGVPFEDPVSVYTFTHTREGEMRRQESLPWDLAHNWKGGDRHNHAHSEAMEPSTCTERVRSYSEGETASLHSIPVVQPTLLQKLVEDSSEFAKGQVT